jgi:hypothetical protein
VGGGIVPTFGAARARIVTAAGAVAVAAFISLAPATAGGGGRLAFVALAALGVPLTLIACTGRPAAAPWAVVALGAGYAVSLLGRGGVDPRAPIIGAGLLVLSELIHWSLRARSSAPPGWTDQRGLVDLALFGLGSVTLGAIVVAAGSVSIRDGVTVAVVGVLASIAILGVIVFAARRGSGSRSVRSD